MFGRLGERQPAVVVFEDLHWADPSTQDLIAFLARNLRSAAVAMVLTYRSDELHRRHPLFGLLADLHRDPDLEAITLSGFGRPELVALVSEISPEPVLAAKMNELADRSGGNPFYVEELIAAGRAAGLPASLAEAILARVDRLAEPVPTVPATSNVSSAPRDLEQHYSAPVGGGRTATSALLSRQ